MRKGHKKGDPREYGDVQDRISQLIKEGWLINELRAEIYSSIPEFNQERADHMIKAAYAEAKATIHRNRDYIFKLHMDRYEKIFSRSMEMINDFNQVVLDKKKDFPIILAKYSTAIKALKQKEDLVGLHNKDVVLELTEDSVLLQSKPDKRGGLPFKLKNLSFEEMLELVTLIKEAKVSEDDGRRRLVVKKLPVTIDITNPLEQEEVVDTIYEEMPIKVVDKLQVVELQEKVEEEPPATDAEGVKRKLNEAVKKQFEELLKKKKG